MLQQADTEEWDEWRELTEWEGPEPLDYPTYGLMCTVGYGTGFLLGWRWGRRRETRRARRKGMRRTGHWGIGLGGAGSQLYPNGKWQWRTWSPEFTFAMKTLFLGKGAAMVMVGSTASLAWVAVTLYKKQPWTYMMHEMNAKDDLT